MSAEQDLARALASVGGNLGRRTAKDSNREFYRRLLAQGGDTSPVQHWAQGLARITQGLAGGWLAGHERRKEEAGGAAIAEAAKSGDFKTLAEALAKSGDTGSAAQVAVANALYEQQKAREKRTGEIMFGQPGAGAGPGSGAGAAAGGALPMPQGPAPPGGLPGSAESLPQPQGGAVDIIRMVEQEARAQGVPVEIAKRLAMQESTGNPNAVSPQGARGVMQLMPGTARDLGVANPMDAATNVRGGVSYLKQQLAKYGDVTLALAAYNMGPGAVDTWIKGGADPAKLPQETRQYIARILGEGSPEQAFPRGPLTAAGPDAPVQSASLPPPGGPVAPVPPPMPAQAPVGAPPMMSATAAEAPMPPAPPSPMAQQPYGMTGPTPPPAGAAPQIAGGALRFVPSAQAAPTPGLPPMPGGPPQIGPQPSSATAAEGMPLGAPPAPVAAPPASPVVPAQFQPGAPVAPPQGAPQAAPAQARPTAPPPPAYERPPNPFSGQAAALAQQAQAEMARARALAANGDMPMAQQSMAKAQAFEQQARQIEQQERAFESQEVIRRQQMEASGRSEQRQAEAAARSAAAAERQAATAERQATHLTEGQGKAYAFARMAAPAIPILESALLAPEGKPDPDRPGLWARTMAQHGPTNFLASERAQKLEAAKRQIVDAFLRFESGATIQDPEFQRKMGEILPAPGDADSVIKQKLDALRTQYESIARISGRESEFGFKPLAPGSSGIPASPAQGAPGSPVKITGAEDYGRLPPGTQYMAPDGSIRVKK